MPFEPCQCIISTTIKGRQSYCQYMPLGYSNLTMGWKNQNCRTLLPSLHPDLDIFGLVCHFNLLSIIPELNFCPLQCPNCIIAWLPKSSLNRHFLYLGATINHPFTHPSTQHFCHRYTSLPPLNRSSGAQSNRQAQSLSATIVSHTSPLWFSLFIFLVED